MNVKTVMLSILKPFFRLALIMLVVAGIAAMVAGPERVHAMAHQVKTEISDVIDANIDDPVALRSQLRKLQKEYPKRIASVQADLTDLHQQIRELEREKAVAQRVVLLARQDAELQQCLGRQQSPARGHGSRCSSSRTCSSCESRTTGRRRPRRYF